MHPHFSRGGGVIGGLDLHHRYVFFYFLNPSLIQTEENIERRLLYWVMVWTPVYVQITVCVRKVMDSTVYRQYYSQAILCTVNTLLTYIYQFNSSYYPFKNNGLVSHMELDFSLASQLSCVVYW